MERTLANSFKLERPKTTIAIFATNIPRKMGYTRVVCSVNNRGPGCKHCTVRAPIMIAATASPGTPMVSIGISAPPVTPLFPPSGEQ